MDVRSTTASGSGARTNEAKGSLGKDDFVKLLVTQLANQDPTSPMDSQAFVAQLAQFSNVELLQGMGDRLDALLIAQAANNSTNAASLVGREIVFRTDQVELGADGTTIYADLAGKADTVTVTIKDESGRTVRTLRLGAAQEGALEIPWNGLDDQGNPLPPGTYDVEVVAADKEGASIDVHLQGHGRADGVSFENGYPELLIGKKRIALSDVIEIHTI